MNQTTSFVRKAIYLGLVGILLIPVSLISQPESRSRNGASRSGGVISTLRRNHSLSQAQLSDIDPTSETMKLATMGLRGVAVNLLWAQANEQKKKEEWDGFEATLNALIKIQPNFVKVWEFQAHNLSYNISAEFDDYEYRYTWVKKGINFFTEGIKYNLKEHKILDGLGDFCGMKIGNADEKNQFRRMFRKDTDFHEQLREYVEPERYDNPVYGHDHWRLAYWWYDKSEQLVQNENVTKRTNDLIYYLKRPQQVVNQAMGLEREFRTEENIAEIWREAGEKYKEYGDRTIMTSVATEITLNGQAQAFQERSRLRNRLDELAPGFRQAQMVGLYRKLGFSPNDIELQQRSVDDVGEFEMIRYRQLNEVVETEQRAADQMIYNQLPAEQQVEGRELLEKIMLFSNRLEFTERYQGTANYLYWVDRCALEQTTEGVRARQGWWDADELRRKSVFDDETVFNYRTGEKKIKRPGSLSEFLSVFRTYNDLFERYPMLKSGDITESLMDSCKDFEAMLKASGLTWPKDFPLQDLIDRRKMAGDRDELPVSEGVVGPADPTLPEGPGKGPVRGQGPTEKPPR